MIQSAHQKALRLANSEPFALTSARQPRGGPESGKVHMAYQSHADKPGVSKSDEKLAALHMPASLIGKRVLDLGCNEGFFCFDAKRRGAARVVGVDRNEGFINTANERATEAGLDVDFVC